MNTERIIFDKSRDFGEIIGDTFTFIKQNYKSLLKYILIFVGPFMLISAVAAAYYQSHVLNQAVFEYKLSYEKFLEDFFLSLSVIAISSIISFTILIQTVLNYIKLYNEKGPENIETEELGRLIASGFIKTFACSFLLGIILAVGFIMCFLPGIYLAVSLSMFFSIMILESASFSNSFSKSFKLVHNSWWGTFLLILVIYLMVGIASYIITIPQIIISIYAGISGVVNSETSSDINEVLLITTSLSTFLASFLAVIPIVSMAFQYFTLNRKISNN